MISEFICFLLKKRLLPGNATALMKDVWYTCQLHSQKLMNFGTNLKIQYLKHLVAYDFTYTAHLTATDRLPLKSDYAQKDPLFKVEIGYFVVVCTTEKL